MNTLESDAGAGRRGLGQAAGLIRKIRPAADLIEKMIEEANALLPGQGG